jgi:lysophospholipase L1-like esterase
MKLTKSTTALLVLLFTLLGVLLFIYNNKSQLCGYRCFRQSNPAPYQNADYYSTNFLDDSFRFPQPLFDQNDLPYYPAYSSKWLNIENGHRKTSYFKNHSMRTIYIIGGSAVVGQEVPDNWTIPSQLQLLISDNFMVENFGYSGITSKKQLEVIKSLKVKPGDIVISYDGVNDNLAIFLKVNRSQNNTDQAVENSFINSLGILKKNFLQSLNMLRHYLLTYSFFTAFIGDEPTFIFQNFIPEYLKSTSELDLLSKTLKKELITNIELARHSTETRGAKYIHIFQPYLGQDRNLSIYEKSLYSNLTIYPNVLKLALTEGYKNFSTIESEGPTPYLSFKTLSSRLATHDNRQEYFLDFCHLNHEGNRIIAKEIFNFLDKNSYLSENTLKKSLKNEKSLH